MTRAVTRAVTHRRRQKGAQMKTDFSVLPIIAAGALYVFGLIVLSLHFIQSLAILTVQGNWAATVMDHLVEF